MRMYLVKARQDLGYSQRKVANEADISFQHYSMLETGQRGKHVSLLLVGRIARVLEIPLERFYVLEEQYQKEQTKKNASRFS